MKLYGDATHDVDLNNITDVKDFHIESPHKIILTILDNAYSNPTEAMVREICQNASEVDENFTVHLPTDLEPWFSVIDNGTGLSPDDCLRFGFGIGASTKDGDDEQVGGFGIGMKVPMAVSDQYLVISRWEGTEYTFNAFKDDHGIPKFVQTAAHPTDKHNGIEVRVPIESGAFSNTKQALLKMLEYFKTKPATNVEVDWPSTEYSVEGGDITASDGYGIVSSRGDPNTTRWNYSHGSRIIMGNLWYSLDESEIRESYNDDYQWLIECGIDLFLPIGSVSLPLSREAILYTPATIKLIRTKLDVVAIEMKAKMQAALDAQPNVYAAMKLMADSKTLLNRGSKHTYMYKGVEVAYRIPLYNPPCNYKYEVDGSRFRLKSLNLQNYKANALKHKDTGKEYIGIDYTSNELLILLIDESESKRIPSRLLRHIQEAYLDDNFPRVMLFPYTSTTKAKVTRWVYTTFGVTPDTFEDVVDEYTPVKGAAGTRKKVAKVKVLSRVHLHYTNWEDHAGELDLDSNRGVYVDLRRDVLYESKYQWLSHHDLREVSALLVKAGLIDDGGSIYGCPGSHKNKLADHPNYLHLDAAIQQVFDTLETTISVAERTRLNYLVSLKSFAGRCSEVFALDIDVKGSYYNSYKDRLKDYEDTVVSVTPNIETYYKAKRLSYLLRRDDEYELFKDYEDQIKAKFNSKYPVLRAVSNVISHYDDEVQSAALLTDLQEYVKFKTTTITNLNQ